MCCCVNYDCESCCGSCRSSSEYRLQIVSTFPETDRSVPRMDGRHTRKQQSALSPEQSLHGSRPDEAAARYCHGIPSTSASESPVCQATCPRLTRRSSSRSICMMQTSGKCVSDCLHNHRLQQHHSNRT